MSVDGKRENRAARTPAKAMLISRFCRNFVQQTNFDEKELLSLLSSEKQPVLYAAGKTILPEGYAEEKSLIVLSGWCCEQRILENGGRQIFSFTTPGEIYGFEPLTVPLLASFVALTPTVVLAAPRLRVAALKQPVLAEHLYRKANHRITYIYDQIQRLGCQSAYERLSDLLAELFQRITDGGLDYNDTVPFPLTQETLADALGLSAVHINRTLQRLRRDGILELSVNRLKLYRSKELRLRR